MFIWSIEVSWFHYTEFLSLLLFLVDLPCTMYVVENAVKYSYVNQTLVQKILQYFIRDSSNCVNKCWNNIKKYNAVNLLRVFIFLKDWKSNGVFSYSLSLFFFPISVHLLLTSDKLHTCTLMHTHTFENVSRDTQMNVMIMIILYVIYGKLLAPKCSPT